MVTRFFILAFVLPGFCARPIPAAGQGGAPASDQLKIWFEDPADRWEEALPIGNGRLGAMVFGRIAHERIQLNEDSLSSGGYLDRIDPHALEALPQVRKLLWEGKPGEALKLADRTMMSHPSWMPPYRPLGDLDLDFANAGTVTGYRRQLDLDTAITTVTYQDGATRQTREVFSSGADQVIVIHLASSAPKAVCFSVAISRQKDAAVAIENGQLVLTGREDGGKGMRFAAVVRLLPKGGEVSSKQGHLFVDHADEATILIAGATSFHNSDPLSICRDQIAQASKKSYAQLRSSHLADYQRLFRRVDLNLEGPANHSDIETNAGKRTARWNAGLLAARLSGTHALQIDAIGGLASQPLPPQLATLYFQFGRYLLISSSRPGGMAANMQGLWNDLMWPPWDSKYTININIQMNYWPIEAANLSELHMPLFDLLDTMRGPGRDAAKRMYGARGVVAHHNTDIWGDVAPIDGARWGVWPMGFAWLSLHAWEHYEFTRDREFLAERGYALMKDAAEFLLDYMVEDKQGRLVTGPSLSPENSYLLPSGEVGVLCMGPSIDSQIAYALFTHLIQASEILDRDPEFRRRLIAARDKLPKPQIGKHGQVMEWLEDYDEPEPGHRHLSPLFALYPGSQITRRGTPQLADAARITLQRRLTNGGGNTGWSRAWIVNLYARLGDSEKAYANLINLIQEHTMPNLFDFHPPYRFQIDGNLGGTAAILEMLLQSHAGEVELLPALPRAWPSGHFRGLRARGGLEVDLKWGNGLAAEAQMRAIAAGTFRIRPPQKQTVSAIRTGAGAVPFRTLNENVVEVTMEPQRSYVVSFSDSQENK